MGYYVTTEKNKCDGYVLTLKLIKEVGYNSVYTMIQLFERDMHISIQVGMDFIVRK